MTTEMPAADLTIDTSSLIKCYGVLILGMIVVFFLDFYMSILGLLLLICGLVWNIKLRRRNQNPLFENHTRWIRRTLGLTLLFSLIAAIVASTIFSSHADATGIDEMTRALENKTATQEMVRTTMDGFYERNGRLMFWNRVGCFGPIALYAIARYIKGYRLSEKGRLIPNVKSWWL